MAVDTEIKGDPSSITSAAQWLRQTMHRALDSAADSLAAARRVTAGSWTSDAGEGFRSSADKGLDEADDLATATSSIAGDLEDFASSMKRCQHEMTDIRDTASGCGLTVSGFTIQDPGPGPSRPADLNPTQLYPPGAVDHHDAQVAAYDAHQDLIRAYNQAVGDTDRVAKQYATACDSLGHQHDGLERANWGVTVSSAVYGTTTTAMLVKNKSILTAESARLQGNVVKARDYLNKMHTDEIGSKTELAHRARLLEDSQNRAAAAARRLDDADRAFPKIRGVGKVLGPLGVALGTYSDIQDGESTTQAVVSQGGGALAGAGAGALAGAAIGSVVPVAGTAVGAGVGAIVGAGVGIFSDGAIDSVFENGPDVGAALDEGWDSIKDTGSAVKDAGGWAKDKIGGLFG